MTIDKDYDPIAWGSHLPALMACIGASKGPVLESGVGHFSTPALHAICLAQGRKLYSVESNPEWRELFATPLSGMDHLFRPDWKGISPDLRFGVVFIDDSPGGEHRAEQFRKFIGQAQYVIVHDYHKDNEEAIKPLLADVQSHVCTMYQPPTLVASAFKPVPQSILCL